MVLVSAEAHALLTGTAPGEALGPAGSTSAAAAAGVGAAGVLLRPGSSLSSSRTSFNVTSQRALFWSAGTYHLLESHGSGNAGGEGGGSGGERSQPPLDLYLVASPTQVPRWAALPLPAAGKPPASCVAAGVLAAPVGQLAVAVVAVSGAAAIAASSFGVWRQSATLLWREAARLALAHSGFLATTRSAVVAAAGCDAGPTAVGLKAAGAGGSGHTVLLTAAFPSAVAAMRWSAALLEWGLLAPWPAALLLHDCAEEIWRDTLPGAAAGTAGAGTVTAQGGFGARVCVAADAAGAAAATMQPLPLTLEPASLQSQGALLSGSAVHVAALRMATGLPSAQRSSSSGLPPQAVGGVTHTALPHAGAAGGTPSQPSRASLLGVAAASSGMLAAPPLALLVEGGADQGRNVLMSESALELPRNLHGVPPSDKIRPASGHVAHASSGSHSRGGARVRGLCLDAVGGGSTRPGSSNTSTGHATPPSRTHTPMTHAIVPRGQAVDPLLTSLPELDGGCGANNASKSSGYGRQGTSDVGTGGFGSHVLPPTPAESVGGGSAAVTIPVPAASNPGEPIRSNVHTSPSASTHLTAATSSSAHCSTHSSSGHAGGSGRTGGGSGGRVSGFSAAAHGRMRPPTVLEVSPSLIPAGLEHHFMGGDVSSGAEGGVVPPPRMVLAVGRPRHAYPDAGSSAAAASPGTQMSDRGPGHRTSVGTQDPADGSRRGSRPSNFPSAAPHPVGSAACALAECPGDVAAHEDGRGQTGVAVPDAGTDTATGKLLRPSQLQPPAVTRAPDEEGQPTTLLVGVERGEPLQLPAQWSPASSVDITLAAQPVRSITAAPDYPTSQSEPQSQQPAACADASSAQQTAGGGEGGGTGATDQSQAEAGSYRPGALRTVTQSGCITSAHTVASTLSSTADGEGPGLHAAAATASGPAASQPTQPPQLPHHPQQSSIQGNNSVAATGPRAAVPAAVVDLDGRGQVGEIGLLPPPRPMRTSAIGSLPTCSSVQGGGGSSQVGFNKDSDGGVMLASEYLPFFLCRGLRLRCGVDYGVVTADVST